MFADRPSELIVSDAFIRVSGLLAGTPIHLKIEGFSAGGSIKTKTARQMIDKFEAEGRPRRGVRLIESSSGNLGLALSTIAAERGYRFTCVSDPNLSGQTHKLMVALGADVVVIDRRDANGGFLGSRIAYIQNRLRSEPGLVWLNQYASDDNPAAHFHHTGPELFAPFGRVDFAFVGAGTTGTLGGLSRFARLHSPATRIVAVDSVGSVTFGTPPGGRHIPGLGTSTRPPIADHCTMDALEMVPEADTILMCRRLAAQGLLVGGSTGTVLAAAERWADRIPRGATVVALSPDLGERYVDTIYDDRWVDLRFAGLLDECRRAISAAPSFWEAGNA